MRLLFIIDPPGRLSGKKDSSVAIMRAAAARGWQVWAATPAHLSLSSGGEVCARADLLALRDDDARWFEKKKEANIAPADVDAALMRKEPPVDAAFVAAAQMLEFFNRAGAPVFNAPATLLTMNEKIAPLRFDGLSPPTLVSGDAEAIAAFHRAHDGAVLKPLDGMGGRGVFLSPRGDDNLKVILQTLGAGGEDGQAIAAQRAVPAAREGDKRVFVIDGEAAPFMLARIPKDGDHRANMAAGGEARALPLDEAGRRIAGAVGETLKREGVLFAGLDVLGEFLTEINITCPTGIRETLEQTGYNAADALLDALEKKIKN